MYAKSVAKKSVLTALNRNSFVKNRIKSVLKYSILRRHDLYGLKYHWVNKYENDMPHLSHKRIYSGTYLIRHTKGIGEMCWIVQDVRTCLIDIPRGSGKCVGLYRMSEYSAFMLVNIYTLGP
jgi:hypothetical protein